MNDRSQHVLNAASNLLGVCFVLITGLRLTNNNDTTIGDECTWLAAIILLASLLLAYLSLRELETAGLFAKWADRGFIIGTFVLFVAVAIIGFALA